MTQKKKNNETELKLILKENHKGRKRQTRLYTYSKLQSPIYNKSAGNGPQHVKKEGDGGDVILFSSFFFLASSPCSHRRSELDHTSLHLLRDKNHAKRKNSECCRNKPSDKRNRTIHTHTHTRARSHANTPTHTFTRTLGSAAEGPITAAILAPLHCTRTVHRHTTLPRI